MKIPFAEIAQNGSHYVITDDAWVAETGLHRTAPVRAELTLWRKGSSRAEVEGFVRTGVQRSCDRCLTDCDVLIDAAFHLVFEVDQDDAADWEDVNGLECTADEMDVVQVDEAVVDIDEVLRQQLLLSLPVKQVCSPDCRGFCPRCGIDLNHERCLCSAEAEASPFAVLKTLKKQSL